MVDVLDLMYLLFHGSFLELFQKVKKNKIKGKTGKTLPKNALF